VVATDLPHGMPLLLHNTRANLAAADENAAADGAAGIFCPEGHELAQR
jgi:hypothetical protein